MVILSDSRVWFITGASSGFGRALLEAVLQNNERAVATVRNISALADLQAKYKSEQLFVVALDVTDSTQIANVFQRVEEHFHRLDVVVNNAGYALVGTVEAISDEQARHQIDTLFWGPVNVTKQAIRFFREVNPKGHGGRVLNVSSVGGYSADGAVAFYNAGKFALEGFTEAFIKEMPREWNITGVIIEPGAFATNIWGSVVLAATHPAYPADSPSRLFHAGMDFFPLLGDVTKAAQAMIRIADEKEPPLRVQLGIDSWAAVNFRAKQTLRDQEKWAEVSHGTNLDGTDPDILLKSQEAWGG